jgi:hypothetical protein
MAMENAALFNWSDLVVLAVSQLAVKAFGNVDTACRPAEALIRRHPHTPTPRRSVTLELDDEEWIHQVLTVGYRGLSHGDKLGLLLRKCSVAVISVKHIGYRLADSKL